MPSRLLRASGHARAWLAVARVEWVLQVPIAGSLLLFVIGALIFQFSATALGILIATFTTSMSQFGLLCVPILVILQLLSGGSTPLETSST